MMATAAKNASEPAEAPKIRKVQPKCGECNHPQSFHKGGTGKCTAMACNNCNRWRKPKASST